MKTINTHRLTIDAQGLATVSKEISGGAPLGCRYNVYYDTEDGAVWCKFHASENEWTEYRSHTIIDVFGTRRPMSAQTIADRIAERIEEIKHIEETCADYLDEGYVSPLTGERLLANNNA